MCRGKQRSKKNDDDDGIRLRKKLLLCNQTTGSLLCKSNEHVPIISLPDENTAPRNSPLRLGICIHNKLLLTSPSRLQIFLLLWVNSYAPPGLISRPVVVAVAGVSLFHER